MRARQRPRLVQLALQRRRLHPIRPWSAPAGTSPPRGPAVPSPQRPHPSPRCAHPAAASRGAASRGRAGSRTSAPASPAFTAFAGARVAVARHIDQRQPAAEIEEVELPRAPRRADTRASARRPVSAFSSDDLPTLDRPANATSGARRRRQLIEPLRARTRTGTRRRTASAPPRAAPLRIRQVRASPGRARCVRRMISHCCAIDSRLFQLQ